MWVVDVRFVQNALEVVEVPLLRTTPGSVLIMSPVIREVTLTTLAQVGGTLTIRGNQTIPDGDLDNGFIDLCTPLTDLQATMLNFSKSFVLCST